MSCTCQCYKGYKLCSKVYLGYLKTVGGVRDPTFHQQTNRQINLQDSQQTPVYTPPPPFVLVGGIIRRVLYLVISNVYTCITLETRYLQGE